MKAITNFVFLAITASLQCDTTNGADPEIGIDFDLFVPPADDYVSPRFNKFHFVNKRSRSFAAEHLPLDKLHYPISNDFDILTMLRRDTDSISVVDDKDDIEIEHDVAELIESAGGLPDHPSTSNSAPYWEKLEKVIDMRVLTTENLNAPAKDIVTDIMQFPERWTSYTMNDVAEAVHDEYPGQHQAEFILDLLKGKYGGIQFDSSLIARRARAQFLRGIVMLADLNTWSVSNVGPYNFAAKWFAGRARPEVSRICIGYYKI